MTTELEQATREYARTRDPRLRARLAERHAGLVRALAGRFAGGTEPLEDLLQVGSVGLLLALDRYDPGRGTRFSTFATPTILGELRRHLRDRTAAVQVPRPLRERREAALRAAAYIAAVAGRAATAAEVAERLGDTEEQVLEALACAGAMSPRSLDAAATEEADGGDGAAAGEGTPLGELLGSRDPAIEAFERHADLRRALACLGARERSVLALRYWGGLSRREAARRAGLSDEQVWRLERLALGRLRQTLSG